VEVKTVSIGTMIEDAEDGDTEGWYVYDNTPNGASVSNVYDTEKDSNVIQLNAPGNHRNGFYHYRNTLDRENTTLQWDMKNYTGSGRFTVYTIVRLKNRRYAYLVYKNYGRDSVSRWGRWYIIYKRVDADMTDGSWHAFRRNLQEDVRSVKSRYSELENAEIDYILNVIYLRGSYQIDDIMFTP